MNTIPKYIGLTVHENAIYQEFGSVGREKKKYIHCTIYS